MNEEKKLVKRDKKFLKALEAGARMAETSISKIHWDIGQEKIKVTPKRLDYQIHWVLDCASDLIAQEKWFEQVFKENLTVRNPKFLEEPHHYIVVIEYGIFRDFVGREIKVKEAVDIFLRVPEVILTSEPNKVKIPLYFGDERWGEIGLYKDNICGVAIAYEDKFEQHRSNRKLRGRGVGKEEPVFILVFSNEYGRYFVKNAMHRKGTQLQDPNLYKLDPKAQELFQSVRWNNGLIVLNTESISRIVGWTWPVKRIQRLYERVDNCRKILKILKENEFINYDDKTYELGRTIDRKAWRFFVRKRKLIGNQRKINRELA
ncbi:MAG: hypothetical protein ISS41_03305 [Candidatus Aminicenantes bacterium]|nr:hypothetical protein [Candidatus Aminicenantes bacterium]